LKKRTKLRLILFALLLGCVFISPSFADEQEINLTPSTPYIDVPVIVEQESLVNIQTTNGTPQTNPNFIDSWIYFLDSANNVLFADDDSNHNGQNILASKIQQIVQAGQYVIRATSFAFVASQGTQYPTGSYLLTWDGVTTVQTTPTPTPTPTQSETVNPSPSPTTTPTELPSPQPTTEPTPTNEPSPSATPEPSPTETFSPTPTPTPELTQEPQPEPNTNNQQSQSILIQDIPTPTPEIALPEIEVIEPEIVEEIVEPETIETPIIEPELSVEQEQEILDELYIAENTIELQVPTALEDIPGVAQIFAAAEAILNVGSDMTEEQREESQSVVVAAIVVTQIASMASVSASQSKRLRK
jgi:hypothetical protein